MYAYLKQPLGKSQEDFNAAMTRLATLCGCHICSDIPEDSQPNETFCVPLLAEILVITLRNLSLIHPDMSLDPYRSGLEKLYRDYETLVIERQRNRVLGILSRQDVHDGCV